jgi:hypothetical protein
MKLCPSTSASALPTLHLVGGRNLDRPRSSLKDILFAPCTSEVFVPKGVAYVAGDVGHVLGRRLHAAVAVVVVAAVGVTGASSVGEALASAGCESEAIRVGEAVVDEGATASGAEGVGGDEAATDDEYRC